MPKTVAPLLSFSASGQIAKTQVYSSWRGIPYVRRYAIPNNPRSTDQVAVRGLFSKLNQMWLFAPTDVTAPWDAYATGRPFLGRNALISKNSLAMAGPPMASDMDDFVFSPGARGGLPPSNMVLTGGSGQVSVAFVAPTAPAGWTLTKGVVAAVPNLAPDDPFGGVWKTANETPPATPIVLTGLTNGTLYVVGLWLVWTKPDGSLAYSVSLKANVTPA